LIRLSVELKEAARLPGAASFISFSSLGCIDVNALIVMAHQDRQHIEAKGRGGKKRFIWTFFWAGGGSTVDRSVLHIDSSGCLIRSPFPLVAA